MNMTLSIYPLAVFYIDIALAIALIVVYWFLKRTDFIWGMSVGFACSATLIAIFHWVIIK